MKNQTPDYALPFVTVSRDFQGKGNAAHLTWYLGKNWTLAQLFTHMTKGYPVAIGYYNGGVKPIRRSGDFICAWLIGLDFDNLTPESAQGLISESFVTTYAAFTYTTPSHTPEKPRLRIFFALDTPIEGKERYENNVATLLQSFASYQPDKACKDAARLFFGNPNPDRQYTHWFGNVLPVSILDDLQRELTDYSIAFRETTPVSVQHGETLPISFIEALQRELHLTGRKRGEFLECHCPIHPPDEKPSAGWHPDKHFLWCYHENTFYLAKDVGERLGIHLRDYITKQQTSVRANSTPTKNETAKEANLSALSFEQPFPQLDADSVAAFASLNEYGDAKLLIALTEGRLLYDRSQRLWYWWSGNWWRKDAKGQTPELLYRPVGELYAVAAGEYATRQAKLEAQLERDKNNIELTVELNRVKTIAKELANRPRSLRTHTRAQNVLQIASGLCSLVGHEWDNAPMLLGVKNGVLDLRTGELRKGRFDDLIRKVSPVEYDPNATAPRWEQFITEIFDGDNSIAAFVQRLLGYCITGITTEHILPVFYGRGRNGKDTLVESVAHALGDYASVGSGDLLIEPTQFRGQATPHLYELIGRRLVWITETSEGAKLNVNQVKYITGAGRITARPLYGGFVEFEATHHVLLFTNHRPRVPSQSEDYAIWKRLLLIPLVLSFVDNPTAPHERLRDSNLKLKLQQEATGILNWLVQGCLEWQQQGLNPPLSILNATAEYARSEDLIGQFIEERCELEPSTKERATLLYSAFRDWTNQNGYPEIGMRKFGERLTTQFAKERSSSGMVYIGLSLRAD